MPSWSYKHAWKSTAALALLFGTMGTSFAAEHRVECPAILQADALQVVKQPAGWTAFVPHGLWLHAAGPMDGPPSGMAILTEHSSLTNGGKVTRKWTWGPRGDTYPDGKWIACYYGDANEVILSQRIVDDTSECVVTSMKNEFGRADIDIRCKW